MGRKKRRKSMFERMLNEQKQKPKRNKQAKAANDDYDRGPQGYPSNRPADLREQEQSKLVACPSCGSYGGRHSKLCDL
jgi:hypothetical protein